MTPEQLQNYVELVETGKLDVKTGPVFQFEELIEAHTLMDENRAGGKIVVRGSDGT
jgi:NADPH:quinone reductase-like Zn-dependent oxidoreductase